MEAEAGIDFNLTCKHPTLSTAEYIDWYSLSPGQGLLFLINGYSKTDLQRFSLLFESESRKSSVLVIRNIEPEDSGVYYCAKSDTVMQGYFLSVQYVILEY
uniref:Ig-like domain-containing protein n=1 Tax=Pyxicephalus adspersus TaxID=30357 RepID=A0AAV3A7M6_PYXAD|nr:TPA: hypothetical protein GDO54_013631 [Pyxicephalus adspersus]